MLRRSRSERVLCGVCGGVGCSLGVDPALVRVVAVLLGVAGVGVPAYLVACLVVPKATDDEPAGPTPALTRHRTVLVLGTALVVVGVLLTAGGATWLQTDLLWPALVALAAAGVLVVGWRR